MAAIGCGCDDEHIDSNNGQEEKPGNNVKKLPTVDESSVCYINGHITFIGTLPSTNHYFKVWVSAQQEGAQEKEYSVEYSTEYNLYQASADDLKRNEKFWCRVCGYNYEGEKLMETSRLTIETVKDDGPDAPSVSGITIVTPTSKKGTDGKLLGDVITTAMEYSTDNGKTWTPVNTDGIITGLTSGIVLLRYKETDTKLAGQIASITIPEHQNNTDADGDGGKSEGLV